MINKTPNLIKHQKFINRIEEKYKCITIDAVNYSYMSFYDEDTTGFVYLKISKNTEQLSSLHLLPGSMYEFLNSDNIISYHDFLKNH